MANEISQSDVQQLQELHDKLAAKAFAATDICGVWNTIKPYWPIVLRVVKLIPRVGDVIAAILDRLGKALDAFCGGK